MKKTISIILSVILCMSVFSLAFSASAADGKLKFHEDGSFKILMMNDTQDDQKMHEKTKSFIQKALEQEKPDLVVVAGDILADMWAGCTEEKIDQNLKEICGFFESAKIPFGITMGNHDHDRADDASSIAHIMEVATSFSMHVSTTDGCDPATYSIPIYSSDGSRVSYVVYMMDTNNKGEALSVSGYTGLKQEQIDWYKATAEAYKVANNGSYVPSTVIQHVPVAEIYDFLVEVPMSDILDSDVVYSSNDKKWYRLNNADYADLQGVMGEAPCSELVSTGEYDAWKDTGVVSAFFAHDHVNTFEATTKDGIYMGYNGGTGFNVYGTGANRSMRVIRLHEDDTTKIDTNLIYYKDVCGENFSFFITDVLSPVIVSVLMKMLNLIPALFAKMF